jgi:hypothetical protein
VVPYGSICPSLHRPSISQTVPLCMNLSHSQQNNTSSSSFSTIWRFPKVPAGLELGSVPSLVMERDGAVRVGWPAGEPGARRLVRLEHETDLTLFVEREWRSDEDAQKFVKEQCHFLTAGMKVAVFRMTKSNNLVGFKDRSWTTTEIRREIARTCHVSLDFC